MQSTLLILISIKEHITKKGEEYHAQRLPLPTTCHEESMHQPSASIEGAEAPSRRIRYHSPLALPLAHSKIISISSPSLSQSDNSAYRRLTLSLVLVMENPADIDFWSGIPGAVGKVARAIHPVVTPLGNGPARTLKMAETKFSVVLQERHNLSI